MKTKLLALGFSLAFLLGNAAYSEPNMDPQGPIHTLELFVVYPHTVKLLNNQRLDPVDWDSIIRSDVEEIIAENRRIRLITMIAYQMEVIQNVQTAALTES